MIEDENLIDDADKNYEVKEIDVEQGKKFSFEAIENELKKPKQPQNDEFLNSDEDILGDDNSNLDDEQTENKDKSPNAKRNAEIISKAIDRFGAFGFSLYAKEENSDYFRIKQNELKMLTEELQNTLEDAPDFKMPSYIGLLIVLPVIYMPIFKKAKDLRKINLEKEQRAKKPDTTKYYKVDDVVMPKKPQNNTQPIKNVSDAKIIEEKTDLDLKKEEILKPKSKRGRPKGSTNRKKKK